MLCNESLELLRGGSDNLVHLGACLRLEGQVWRKVKIAKEGHYVLSTQPSSGRVVGKEDH